MKLTDGMHHLNLGEVRFSILDKRFKILFYCLMREGLFVLRYGV